MSLRPSCGTRLSENSLGRTISTTGQRAWRHPWFTEAQWLPKKKAWVAFVVAGFVNGFAPVVRTTAGDLRDARGTFFGQLVDARTGAAEIEQLAQLAIGGGEDAGLPDSSVVDVPLYQRPPISLNAWRNIGWDGESAVPKFFQDRGVNKPVVVSANQLLGGGPLPLDVLNPPKGNRLLRACDVILHQPRTALTSNIQITPSGIATGASLVTQTLGLREAAPNDKLKIQTGTFEELAQSPLNYSGATSLVADYEEKTWDEVLISTVYLMSPPDAPLGSNPDATWQAFSKHNLFWNLSWAQPKPEALFPGDIFAPLVGLLGVIGGGAGFGWATYATASINDATQAAYNLLTAKSLTGYFWTPTGGGTAGSVPVTAAPPKSTGLDKGARSKVKALAAAAEKRNRRLDPKFPFEGRKFNRSLL